jgi:hypothetical protein
MVLCLSRVLILYQLQPCSGQVLWYRCTVSGCRSRNLRLHSHHCDSRRPTAHSRRSTLSALSCMQVECLRVRAAPRSLLPPARWNVERGVKCPAVSRVRRLKDGRGVLEMETATTTKSEL